MLIKYGSSCRDILNTEIDVSYSWKEKTPHFFIFLIGTSSLRTNALSFNEKRSRDGWYKLRYRYLSYVGEFVNFCEKLDDDFYVDVNCSSARVHYTTENLQWQTNVSENKLNKHHNMILHTGKMNVRTCVDSILKCNFNFKTLMDPSIKSNKIINP